MIEIQTENTRVITRDGVTQPVTVRQATICTVPIDVANQQRAKVFVSSDGKLMGALAEKHGDHHVDMILVGDFGVGLRESEMIPLPAFPQVPPFAMHDAVRADPLGTVPRARYGEREVVFAPPESRSSGADMLIVWKGSTTTGPRCHVEAHVRIGHGCSMGDVVGWHGYSDPDCAEWDVEEPFSIEFGEPVSWSKRPEHDQNHADNIHVFRGTILFTVGEERDASFGDAFLGGMLRARCTIEEWDGRFGVRRHIGEVHSATLPRTRRQIDMPSGGGGRDAFGVQEVDCFGASPAAIEDLVLQQSVEGKRGMHYVDAQGRPFSLTHHPEYAGKVYNSQIDGMRFRGHSNWGKPQGIYRPRYDEQGSRIGPHDWGHIALGYLAQAYWLSSDPFLLRCLQDQAEVLLAGTGFGLTERTDSSLIHADRYFGQPLCAAAILHRALDGDYKPRIEEWARGQFARAELMRDTPVCDWNGKVWPGHASVLYGASIPNGLLTDGKPLGYAPWQGARFAEAWDTWLDYMPSVMTERCKEVGVRVAESVVLEGFDFAAPSKHSYYVVSYDRGRWLNYNGGMLQMGYATPSGGYLWTCMPAIALVARHGTDPDARQRADALIAMAREQVRTADQASWMVCVAGLYRGGTVEPGLGTPQVVQA